VKERRESPDPFPDNTVRSGSIDLEVAETGESSILITLAVHNIGKQKNKIPAIKPIPAILPRTPPIMAEPLESKRPLSVTIEPSGTDT
jgi:hypothetical protein